MYLLDTNVVSELRKPRPDPYVVTWLRYTPADELSLSAVTIAEIQRGVEAKRANDPAKAQEIESWLEEFVLDGFRILPFDHRAARAWARLIQGQPKRIVYDAMIAAISEVHRFTVVTRNVRDFRLLGTSFLNPFDRQ